MQKAKLYINGDEKGDYFSEYDWSVREGGYYEPGEMISIRFVLEDDSLEIDEAYFYYESKQVLKAWYKDAVSTTCNVSKITSSHLNVQADISPSSKYLVFTIPYEDDWIVKVDGKRVRPVKVMDALMAVKISGGAHDIDLRYVPKGIITGLPVSIISCLLAFYFVVLRYRRKNDL